MGNSLRGISSNYTITDECEGDVVFKIIDYWGREYICKSGNKSEWSVSDWESLHRVKYKHAQKYPNAKIAYENKKIQREIEKSPLYKALKEE